MTLQTGTRLGPYEILSALGAGGMGEVYRATDTNLKRQVAIKVLPRAMADDPERLARFQREAEVLAALNHPNIAHIHGLEKADGTFALVMELVEGPTLADRIAQGPIPLNEALPIARQIAEALEAAHEQGIIHRDLKPANIKVREDGTVKILDFGLAKLVDPASTGSQSAGVTASPTITTPAMMTGVGVILGTAAYMSPEQARGKPVDKRVDIWAFGAVLFEMLTGGRAFAANEISDTLAFIITKEPDWALLPAATPPAIRRLLRRCLEKDSRERLPDIGSARLEIKEALIMPSTLAPLIGTRDVAASAGSAARALPWGVAAALAAALVGAVAVWAPQRTVPAPPVRMSAELGVDASLAETVGTSAVALSPGGATLAFTAQKGDDPPELYVRRLDSLQATPLPGTTGAQSPFFSPDGQWVAFFSGGKLRKVPLGGGPPQTLCDAANDRGGAWADDGQIVFGTGVSNLWKVSSSGGNPEALTTLAQGEVTQRFPQILPGGKGVLFTSHRSTVGFDYANIVVQPMPSGTPKVVLQGGYYGRYVSSGHIVYVRDGTLFAVPFDLQRLETVGQAVPVVEHVLSDPIGGIIVAGRAQFATSDSGRLVYVSGGTSFRKGPIEWMDRVGKITALRATPANWRNVRFSPDGRRLAMDIVDGARSDIWVYEWDRDKPTRLTFPPSTGSNPVWTPDGRRIVFRTYDEKGAIDGLAWRNADGTGEVQRLLDDNRTPVPTSWDPTGRLLAFQHQSAQTGWDLMLLPMSGDDVSGWKPGTPVTFLGGTTTELVPMFSPDGHWIAYQSNESGRYEIYVRPFPGPGGEWQVSTEGGRFPVWSRVRRELFYVTTDGRIMHTSYVADGNSFKADRPQAWSDRRFLVSSAWSGGFDLHPDGDRFALASLPENEPPAKEDHVVFIFNFFDELRRLAPVKK